MCGGFEHFLLGIVFFPSFLIKMMDVCSKSLVEKKPTRIKAPPQLVNIYFFVVTDKPFFFIDMSKKINDFKSQHPHKNAEYIQYFIRLPF